MRKIGLFLVSFLVTAQAYAGCDPVEDPCAPKKIKDAWQKSALVGFNLTSGNSKTTLLNLGLAAAKETDEYLTDVSAAFNYGEDKNIEDSINGTTTRNDVRVAGSYHEKLTELSYIGFGTKFLHDEIADVDYRATLSPGLGYFVLKDSDVSLALEAGPSYVFEKVGGLKDDYLAPRIADKFNWVISCTSKLYQSAEVLLDVNDSENYLANAEAGVEASLSSSVALVVGVRYTYDNVPASGREKDDLAVITSLKIAL